MRGHTADPERERRVRVMVDGALTILGGAGCTESECGLLPRNSCRMRILTHVLVA